MPSDTTGYHPPVVGCGSIILVTSGNAVISGMSTQIECTQGSVVFVGAGIDVSIDTKDGALIHRAHANLGALNLSHK